MTELHPASLLVDQGLFNLLVGAESSDAYHNFFSSPVVRRWCGREPSGWSFSVSLATILEAIGTKPPHYTGLTIPSHVQKTGDPTLILGWMRRELHQFYLLQSELTITNIKQAVQRQSKRCSREGRILFDMCITQVTESPTFHQSLLSFLEFDAILKFEFPKSIKDVMHHFMMASYLFRGNLKIRNASKFRLVKELWKSVYSSSRLQLDASARSDLDAANKIMMVKNQSDYLDCDMVHSAVFGIEERTGTNRVHCFTADKMETILLRVRAYKGVIKLCQRELPAEVIGKTPPDFVSRANGTVTVCGEDGIPTSILDVSNSAPPFFC